MSSLVWDYPEPVWVQTLEDPTTTWRHEVLVIIPSNLNPSNTAVAFLHGSNNDRPDESPHHSIHNHEYQRADVLAIKSQTIVVMINQIPNQYVIFEGDPDQKPRREDDLLAYAWAQYLKDPDHNMRWLPRLYMVKAAF